MGDVFCQAGAFSRLPRKLGMFPKECAVFAKVRKTSVYPAKGKRVFSAATNSSSQGGTAGQVSDKYLLYCASPISLPLGCTEYSRTSALLLDFPETLWDQSHFQPKEGPTRFQVVRLSWLSLRCILG